MRRHKFSGMGVALITPFKKDGSIDYDALRRLIEYQIQNGTDYFVILGTTAETPTLSDEEKNTLVKFILSQINQRVPVVLGLGGNCTQAIVEKIRATDFSQIDAILSVAPYYNKPSQEGIYQHYKKIAEASKVPVILYNVPGRTGVNISPSTILRLANDFKNIIGVKEASGNFSQIDEIIKNRPRDFLVISGDDGITFPLITLGAVGVISVIGNAFPKEFSRMVQLALNGDYDGAREIHYRFSELIDLLFVDGNPAGVKSMLSVMGFIENELRLPLVPTTINTFEKIRFVLNQLNTKF